MRTLLTSRPRCPRPWLLGVLLGLPACSGGRTPTANTGTPPDTTPTPPPSVATTITVNPAQRFQVLTGWEATAQAYHNYPAYDLFKDSLLTLATDDLGLNRIRIEVRSGSEHSRDYFPLVFNNQVTGAAARCARYEVVNDDADPTHINPAGFHWSELDESVDKLVLPWRQRMAQSGKRLVLGVTYVSFNNNCGTMVHASAAEYGEFVRATVLHLRDKYGFVPDHWETILEPDNTTTWSGRVIGEGIVAAAAALQRDGISMKFVGPSNTDMAAAITFYDAMVAVPGVLPLLSEFSYHRYRGVSTSALSTIASRASRDGVKTAMLEHIGSGVDDLLDDLLIGNNSGWSQFALTFNNQPDDGGLYYITRANDPTQLVREGSRTRFLRQVFTAGPLGSTRIGVTSTNTALRPVAFEWPNGKRAVAIRTTSGATFTVGGLPSGAYRVTYATEATQYGRTNDVQSGAATPITITMPAAGVITLLPR